MRIIFGLSILLNLYFGALLFNNFINPKPDYTGSENEKIIRLISPDSLYEVVYQAKSEGGSLGSVIYQAYIVPVGKEPMSAGQFLVGTHIDSCKILWTNNSMVDFHFKNVGRILDFNNIVCLKSKNGQSRNFEIKLHAD